MGCLSFFEEKKISERGGRRERNLLRTRRRGKKEGRRIRRNQCMEKRKKGKRKREGKGGTSGEAEEGKE